MKILWHSNHPEDKTGFGRQTAYWVPALASLGHEVAISAFHGQAGFVSEWRGHRVYPGGDDPWGMDVVGSYYKHFDADLLITLMDMWPCDPAGFAGLNAAHWVPVDCRPLGAGDRRVLEATGGRVIAMSRFGEQQFRDAGPFDPLYVPHGVDTTVFKPIAEHGWMMLRRLFKLQGKFVIGINAANQDQRRKSYPQQFQAFARFRQRHDDAVLFVHSRADNRAVDGLNLNALAEACGLELGKDVFFVDQDSYKAGAIEDDILANWYRILDVLSMPSHGEGFGLPLIEAQACGIPVITTRAAAMTELSGPGYLIDGQDYWLREQEAWWTTPSVTKLAQAYERAYKEAGRLQWRACEFAQAYDVKRVLKEYWEPALAELATTCRPRPE